MRKTDPALIDELKLLALKGYTQAEAGIVVGKSKAAIASLSLRYYIGGWRQGAAARDQRGNKNPAYKNGQSRATINRLTKDILLRAGRDLFTCERCGKQNKIEWPRHHKIETEQIILKKI